MIAVWRNFFNDGIGWRQRSWACFAAVFAGLAFMAGVWAAPAGLEPSEQPAEIVARWAGRAASAQRAEPAQRGASAQRAERGAEAA